MRRICFCVGIAALLIAAAPGLRAGAKSSEYPLRFTVQVATMEPGPSGGCYMWLSDGKWSFYVENTGTLHCHVWDVGTVLSGKFAFGRSWIYLLATDDQGKTKKYNCKVIQQRQ